MNHKGLMTFDRKVKKDSFYIYKAETTGTLPLGEKLPSVRELSTQLTINPNTIQRAYRELETEGYICSVAGRGSYVCAQIPDDPARQDALLQQFDAAVQELLYLGMRSEELRRRIPEGGTNHD